MEADFPCLDFARIFRLTEIEKAVCLRAAGFLRLSALLVTCLASPSGMPPALGTALAGSNPTARTGNTCGGGASLFGRLAALALARRPTWIVFRPFPSPPPRQDRGVRLLRARTGARHPLQQPVSASATRCGCRRSKRHSAVFLQCTQDGRRPGTCRAAIPGRRPAPSAQ